MSQGLFLGKEAAISGDALGARIELSSADLLTHGLIVGMTGSGKTGLAIGLIEEVLGQGIPVIAIDPKGDLGNLLLLFEDLSAAVDLRTSRASSRSIRRLFTRPGPPRASS